MESKYTIHFHPFVDKEPVKVKIIQRHKSRVEITRNLEGKAGFWVNDNEITLIEHEN